MSRSVMQRHGFVVLDDGSIEYDDRPSTIEEAERLAGRKLDRRCNYAIVEGRVCRSVSWSQHCSGCFDGSVPMPLGDRGMGCRVCGYHGRVRVSMWIPIDAIDQADEASRE